MQQQAYAREDFDQSPFVVFYEVTQACDLACLHCRACAQPAPDPDELDTGSAKDLLNQLATFPKKPLIVFTGGDPLKREDVFELIATSIQAGLTPAMTPSATPLVTREAVQRMRQAGLTRLAVSLDGADAATHDGFRGVGGSLRRTMEIMADARAAGLPLQVNTTITPRNVHQVDAMARLLDEQGVVLWSVFFLVPVGRGALEPRITADQYERVFERLWHHSQRRSFAIKTTEAPHYRRYVLEHRPKPGQKRLTDHVQSDGLRAPLGVNDGKGVMFVSHVGRIFPSGFLPIECGRFPGDSVVDVYQRSPVFKALRDPEQLGGKCGACEFKTVCGGSRARALAVSGDMLGEEPDCTYVPRRWEGRRTQPPAATNRPPLPVAPEVRG